MDHNGEDHPCRESGVMGDTVLRMVPAFDYAQVLQDSMHIVLNQGKHGIEIGLGNRPSNGVLEHIESTGQFPDHPFTRAQGGWKQFPWIAMQDLEPSRGCPQSQGGGKREVLVKQRAHHFLKAMMSGLSSIIMFILLPTEQAKTMAHLYHCWQQLLRPEIPEDVGSSQSIGNAHH
ncbi:TPA: hypothetical protein ACH3X2_005008 [Trebouxia sp. C0005]